MSTLAETIVKRRRCLVVDKIDTMDIVEVLFEIINETRFSFLMRKEVWVGYREIKNEPDKLCVQFDLTDKRWDSFVNKLKCENREITVGEKGLFYLT